MPRFAAVKIRPILLIAATAAGLLAPVTAAAAEFELERYSRQGLHQDQVTSISQFTDLRALLTDALLRILPDLDLHATMLALAAAQLQIDTARVERRRRRCERCPR